ncbi:hypothetical protein GCM10010251_86910 [Streptomyces aurantiogriseus]|uniref:Uncharacterized protein n=1 Tax=Streptomyces aurantiogriseus TaxID=66870 RepID=A0A918FN45_9ACTN|nr:hypothetical protein GCM10010251_86910 [Streptomyces aurantiogriseus]
MALDAVCVRALLQVAGLVDDQHRVVVPQLLDDETADVVADRVGVPLGSGQQVLQTVRGRVSGVLGKRPAVLARQVRHQPEDELPCPAPRFHPGKAPRDAAHQGLEHVLPAGRTYAVTCGHRLIFCLHTPMITGGRTRSLTALDQQDHDLQLEYQADTETPELELTVSGDDAETHLLALRDWLALEDALRGRLELRGSAPGVGPHGSGPRRGGGGTGPPG